VELFLEHAHARTSKAATIFMPPSLQQSLGMCVAPGALRAERVTASRRR
jgi:hypothetical protein